MNQRPTLPKRFSASVLKQSVSGFLAAFLLLPGLAFSLEQMNMTPGVTPLSREMYDIHMLIMWIVTVVGVLTFGALFYAAFKFRKSKGAVAAKFHENTKVEIIWTAIPFVVLVFMAIPATKALLVIEDTDNSEMTIQAKGYQWKWQYTYLDEDISFFSNLSEENIKARQMDSGVDPRTVDNYLLDVDNPMVVPTNKKIRILTTANDVIHGWWVPELGVKRDAIPGFINESWMYVEQEGTYRGQCVELCGKDHGYMPIVVVAKNEADYQLWVAEQKAAAAPRDEPDLPMEEMMALGEKEYLKVCAACHQPNGQGAGPFPPLVGSKSVSGPIEEHVNIILQGKGQLMPAFAEQLTNTQIAAIVTYERNAWGIDSGDIIQPSAVKAAR